MYCSSCGAPVAQGLSYCKHCGARLTQDNAVKESSGPKAETLIQAMSAVFVLGMIGIIILMGVMKVILGLTVETILVVTLIPFLMMFLLEGVFIKLLFRRDRSSKDKTDKVLAKAQATNELDAAQARALAEHTPSVTENTTRAFDRVYSERKQN